MNFVVLISETAFTSNDIIYYALFPVSFLIMYMGFIRGSGIFLAGLLIFFSLIVSAPIMLAEANWKYYKRVGLADNNGVVNHKLIVDMLKKGYVFKREHIVDKNGKTIQIKQTREKEQNHRVEKPLKKT